MARDERAAAWGAVNWQASVWILGLADELAARLYLAGYRTVGDLDRAVLDYREEEVAAKASLRPSEKRLVIRKLHAWCEVQFLGNRHRDP